LEHIRLTICPKAKADDGKRHRTPYQYVIEGDIRACFDEIDHHRLMLRIRKRVADNKVNRLVVQLLKAGVLTEEQFIRTSAGTPQGGNASPLLANIALSAIEERYERWVNHQTKIRSHRKSNGVRAALGARTSDRRTGRPVFYPIRYADDFVILVSGSREQALAEKERLTQYINETLGLHLSSEKTKVTALTDGFDFLGHRVRLRWDTRFGYTPRIEIPKVKQADLRYKVKQLTKLNKTYLSLDDLLQELNPLIRGWGNFYRFCTNAKDVFSRIDWYVRDRIWRWMCNKYPNSGARWIAKHLQSRSATHRQEIWRAQKHEQFLLVSLPVRRYRRGWMKPPDFAMVSGEPDA